MRASRMLASRRTARHAVGLGLVLLLLLAAGCAAPQPADRSTGASAEGLRVVAVESFLTDMAQNVAGERLVVETLMPLGADPHSYQPTPVDVARAADSDLLLANGAGFEAFLDEILANAGGKFRLVALADGLTPRDPNADEPEHEDEHADDHGEETDPHFWLDPVLARHYVEGIRDALIEADPAGAEEYTHNTYAYLQQLRDLDTWARTQIEQVPPERRLIVTNHESLGYYADRYGLRVVGAIVPSVSSGASPSAQQLAVLVEEIRDAGAPAIFLELGANPQLAEQIASETDVQVVTDIYTHSLSDPDGPAPTYIDMIRHNTSAIVEALR